VILGGAGLACGGAWQSATLDRHGLRPRDDGMGVGASATMNSAGDIQKP